MGASAVLALMPQRIDMNGRHHKRQFMLDQLVGETGHANEVAWQHGQQVRVRHSALQTAG